jgi:hypothetical protein
MVMSHYDALEGLCWIVSLLNGHVAMQHSFLLTSVKFLFSLMVMLHCNVHQGLYHIVEIRGLTMVDIKSLKSKLYYITTLRG